MNSQPNERTPYKNSMGDACGEVARLIYKPMFRKEITRKEAEENMDWVMEQYAKGWPKVMHDEQKG